MRVFGLTREAKVIGTHLKLACDNLISVKRLSASSRVSPSLMFYAAENLLMAIFTAEGIDTGSLRRQFGNHQLERMIDELPEECSLKEKFKGVIDLVAYSTTYRYPTPAGNLPSPPSKEDAERYFEDLFDILEVCTRHFKVNLKLNEPTAGSVTPIR